MGSRPRRNGSPSPQPASKTDSGATVSNTSAIQRKNRRIRKATSGFLTWYFSWATLTRLPEEGRPARPGGGSQAKHVADVLQRVQGVHLALAAAAFAHLVAALAHFAHMAAHQNL